MYLSTVRCHVLETGEAKGGFLRVTVGWERTCPEIQDWLGKGAAIHPTARNAGIAPRRSMMMPQAVSAWGR